MTRLPAGTFRHEAEPWGLIWWMECALVLEGSKAKAVTAPISDRRLLSDLPALESKRVEFRMPRRGTLQQGQSRAITKATREGNKRG